MQHNLKWQTPNWLRVLCLTLLVGLTSAGANAQTLANYSFTQTSGTYKQAGLGAKLTTTGCYDDGAIGGAITIPWTFTYHGASFTSIYAQNNGFARLGAATTTTGQYGTVLASQTNVLSPLNNDLYGCTSNGAEVSYAVVGSTPNRVLTVQWSNWGIYSAGANEFSFQIKLYETSNKVQFVYKNGTATGSTAALVGLNGATTSDFQTRTTTTNWGATTAGASSTASCTVNATVRPTDGLTFTWSSAATVAAMAFAQTTTTYIPIEGASAYTSLSTSATTYYDDTWIGLQTIPWTFTYHGAPFTTISISPNGVAQFGVTGIGYYDVMTSTPNVLSPLNGDLYSVPSQAANGRDMAVAVVGTSPNRTYVIQWSRWGFYSGGLNEVSFQIRLSEANNAISYAYGPAPGTASTTTYVGLTGAAISDFQGRTTSTNWAATTASTAVGNTCTISSTVRPVNGLVFTWAPPLFSPCSGTPAPGTTVASANPACSGTNFTLSLSNAFVGVSNLAFQWQSDAGAGFANITGATNATYTANQTAATSYKCVVTCTVSGLSAESTPLTVTMAPFYNCYCQPTYSSGTSGCFYGVISNVSLNTLSHAPACLSAAPYTFKNPPVGNATTSIMQGQTYTLSVTSGLYNGVGVWIDFNQDGLFNASEFFNISGNNNSSGSSWTGTALVTVPYTAVTGLTGMRVMTSYYCCYPSAINANSACSAFTYGESEDYTINILVAPPCSGAPSPGNTITSNASPCAGSTFNLSLQNAISGSSVTYQWQSADDSLFTVNLTNLGTATTQTTSAPYTKYYQCLVTCGGSGITTASTPVAVNVNPIPTIVITPSNGGAFCGLGTMSVSGASTYVWAPSASLSSATASSVIFSGVTNTTFTVTGTSAAGCVGTATQAVTYTAAPAITVTSSTPVFCGTGGTTTLTATSTNSNYVYTFSSLTPSATLSNITSNTADANLSVTSDFLTTANDAGSGCMSSAYTSVGVYPLPSAVLTTSANGVCPGTAATINSGLTAGNFSASCITPAPLTIPATATYLVNNGTAVQALASGSLDDGGWSGIPLGFTFNFFGTNYTTLNVGTNGVLQFGAYNSAALADFTIGALPNTSDPLGAVYACANDLHCGTTGTPATYVRYWTEGYAPNRRFVIEYNVFQFASTTNRVNVQVIVYETLGMVDVIAKQIMSTNSKSIGVNSPTGTIGAAAPNCTTNAQNYWSAQTATIAAANPQAWRFAPPSNYNVVWSANGTQFASGLNIFSQSVSPAITTLYSIIYTNTTTGCSNPANSATVNMTIGIDPGATLANGVSGNYLACPSQTITYSMANSTNAPGLTFQWFNLSGAIPGATNNTYVTTMVGYDEVYCEATCSGGSTYQSGLVVVDMNSYLNCYCIPPTTVLNCTYDWIGNVTLGTINNTSGCTAPYIQYPASGSTTTDLIAGTTMPISLSTVGYSGYFDVFLDINHDGIFQISERLLTDFMVGPTGSSSGNFTGTTTINIPMNALSGLTNLRVRYDYFYTNYNGLGAQNPCAQLYEGETEDYRVNIIPLPATPMAPSEVGIPNCITGGMLASNGAAPAGETWYWQSTATGTSTAQPVSSNLTILSNGTYYVRSQNNTYLTWSAASASITVIDFPAGPADPVTAAQGGNPACGSVTLLSSPAAAGSTNYWQGTNAVGTSTSIVGDNGISNFPYTASSNGTYYIRAQDNITQCWSNPVATPVTIYALPTAPVLSATPGTICPGSTSALTAVAPSAPATGYSVTSIPYAPVSPISTTLAGAGPTGDEGTVVAPLGFSFNYYGTTYSDVQIHTNGYIVFGTNNYVFGSYTPPAIPSTAASNNWVGYWSDMNASAGQITYATQGTAPNRVFIANYNQDQYYLATPYYSGQIVVYEATGAIDVFLEHTQTTFTSACGMENQTGTLGTAAPGRNSGSWAATNEAWHFAPIQAFGFMWSPNGAGSGINAGDETLANISVSPSATTSYTMTVTDPAHGCQNASSIAVNIVPMAPAPLTTGSSTPCGAGTATLSATGTGGTLRWYNAPTGGTLLATGGAYTTPVINATTTYYVEEFNGACAGPRTPVVATYTPSPVVTASSNVSYVCIGGANNTAVLTASSSNASYSYTWQPGGMTGPSVTVTPTATTIYTVTGVDGPCVNVATVLVNGGVVPVINSTIATPATLCVGGTSQLSVDAGQLAPTYCTPTVFYTGVTGDYIESFTFNTISNLLSGDNPSDYSLYSQTTTVLPGSTYALTATPGAAWGQGVGVWIDYNRNGSFADAGEFVFSSASGTATVSGNITIPASASNGLSRIRVCSKYGATPASTDYCGHSGFGEYEDYNITIGNGSGGLTFAWTPTAGVSNASVYNPTATVNASTTYSVSVSDPYGCAATSSVTITANQPTTSTTAITTCAPIIWNGNSYAMAGTYSFTTTNAAGCDSVATLNLTIACSTIVNLTCLIEGYWDAGNNAMLPVLANQGETSTATACDSIDVELHDINTYAMVQSVRTILNQNGTANCVFPSTSGAYYIVVKHRSAIQTWSAVPVTVGSAPVSYNFTSGVNQAYGGNQVEVAPGVWALYSGDIVIDENIDLLDLGTLELDISNFSYGYVSTDLNGDGNVDLLDSPVLESNISNFIFSSHP